MFTINQIQEAHSKVKSGADFPRYIQEIKALGVHSYDTYVTDGHTDYYDSGKSKVSTSEKYTPVLIADEVHLEQFQQDLKAHQQGKTDYITFINDCAKSGVEKWSVDMNHMTCTYFDKKGTTLLEEKIPN
jgi:uncharacterized protein YbcV (DUF1398 family)